MGLVLDSQRAAITGTLPAGQQKWTLRQSKTFNELRRRVLMIAISGSSLVPLIPAGMRPYLKTTVYTV
jgi:hypothetical protein